MSKCTVTMLRNPASAFGCNLHEGETGEIAQPLAEQLVRLNLAVMVSTPKSIQAVPEEPSIKAPEVVVEPPAEDKTDRPKKSGK
jgi:hypothetical protein